MRHLLTHKRFWLFAPFIGLLALGLVTFGLWHLAAGRLSDELTAAGLSWQDAQRHGYPARVSLDIDRPAWRDRDRQWQNRALSITMMPFQGGHAIVDFLGAHEIKTKAGEATLAHQGNLASIVADRGGLKRASFEVEQPRLTMRLKGVDEAALFSATKLGLHGMRHDQAGRYNVALVLKQLSLPTGLGRAAEKKIPRLDMVGVVPQAFLQDGAAAGQTLVLDRLTMERDALTLIARGTIKLGADGFVKGRLDLEAIQLEALIDLLEEFDLISARDRAKWLFFGGLGAALGGNPQDRLSVPLQFKGGRTALGPLDLGPAPRWQ